MGAAITGALGLAVNAAADFEQELRNAVSVTGLSGEAADEAQAKMEALTREDFVKILRETENNLLMQAIELLKTESVNVVFEGDAAVEEMAQVAVELNEEDNIGARRLRTVVDAAVMDRGLLEQNALQKA
jgi:precorrin-3B methylase